MNVNVVLGSALAIGVVVNIIWSVVIRALHGRRKAELEVHHSNLLSALQKERGTLRRDHQRAMAELRLAERSPQVAPAPVKLPPKKRPIPNAWDRLRRDEDEAPCPTTDPEAPLAALQAPQTPPLPKPRAPKSRKG